MIKILTQDKLAILDCNNVMCNIKNYPDRKIEYEISFIPNSNDCYLSYLLGTYPTEERAKRVLLDIWETIQANSFYDPKDGFVVCYPYYEMPQE